VSGASAMNGNPQSLLKPGERLDDLQRDGLRLIQHPDLFAFSMDSVLLSSFARAKHRDVVIDICTGTGVIPLLMWAKWKPKRIVGVEIQTQLADMAKRSVILNDLEDRIEIVEGDAREVLAEFDHCKVDLVVCNPPYRPVDSGPASRSDSNAIARHEHSFSLSDLAIVASRILKSSGRLAVVHRPERLPDLVVELRRNRIEPKRMQLVHTSLDKPARMVLLEAVRDGGKQLSVLPPLVIHGDDGRYTQQAIDIYFGAHGSGDD
jgi:tRNA1Val (adenine37-N6)-methyltransferase